MGDVARFAAPDAATARRLETLHKLIAPSRVAIIGASGDHSKTAGRPAHYLSQHGFGGEVFLVNPRYQAIDDRRCYPSVDALPETPDVGLIVLGVERVADAVRDLARRGTPAAIVLSGGYAEVGEVGRLRQEELRRAAGAMRLLGPNSMGVVNISTGLTLSPSSSLELKPLQLGHIGLVSQSGGVLGSLLSRATARGVGFSKLVATGNEADLDVLDILEYLLQDDETNVIALYLEGLRNPGRFRALAQQAAEHGVPIVVHKVGRSDAGARSAVSHTGALAGADELYDALFEQLGVYRTRTFGELIDVPAALASGRRMTGNRLAILTSTGGAGVLVADSCGVLGLETPPPDEPTRQRLAQVLVGEGAVPDRNPVDVTLAGLKSEILSEATAALLDSPTYDAAVIIVGASGLANPDLAAGSIVASLSSSDKPVLAYVSPYAPSILQHLNQRGVPTYDTPEGCAAALAALHRYAASPAPGAGASTPVGALPPALHHLPHGALNEYEAKRLLADFGIPAVRETIAATPVEAGAVAASFGERVVLKILARDLTHKSDVGGVDVGVAAEAVADRATAMVANVRRQRPDLHLDGLLVQEQIGGIEMIVGVRRDPQLGAAILVGAGGVTAELLGDTAIRLTPVDFDTAQSMIASLKSAPLLRGYRGRPAADVDALARCIVALSNLAEALGDRLLEAEVNPLFVLPQGQGARAADALVILA